MFNFIMRTCGWYFVLAIIMFLCAMFSLGVYVYKVGYKDGQNDIPLKDHCIPGN